MPAIRKLSTDEVTAIQTKGLSQRQLVAQEYDAYLADLNPGDYAEVEIGEQENRLTVTNRFKSAADRRNVELSFLRSNGNIMRFQVLERTAPEDEQLPIEGNTIPSPPIEEAPVGTDAPPSEPVRKKGRPRKSVSV